MHRKYDRGRCRQNHQRRWASVFFQACAHPAGARPINADVFSGRLRDQKTWVYAAGACATSKRVLTQQAHTRPENVRVSNKREKKRQKDRRAEHG